MVRIAVTVQSSPKSHQVISENMSDEDADRALAEIASKVGGVGAIRLPGVVVPAQYVLSAQKIHARSPGGEALRLA